MVILIYLLLASTSGIITNEAKHSVFNHSVDCNIKQV